MALSQLAGRGSHRRGQLPVAAQLALLHAIRQGWAKDTQQWERLERAVQAGAGVRVERAIIQLGAAMGDIIDELSDTLESVWDDALMEGAAEDPAELLRAAT